MTPEILEQICDKAHDLTAQYCAENSITLWISDGSAYTEEAQEWFNMFHDLVEGEL
jgi:hypothetical protein